MREKEWRIEQLSILQSKCELDENRFIYHGCFLDGVLLLLLLLAALVIFVFFDLNFYSVKWMSYWYRKLKFSLLWPCSILQNVHQTASDQRLKPTHTHIPTHVKKGNMAWKWTITTAANTYTHMFIVHAHTHT